MPESGPFRLPSPAGGLTEGLRVLWRDAHDLPEPQVDLEPFLPDEVISQDIANEALPDRHLRSVPPPRQLINR